MGRCILSFCSTPAIRHVPGLPMTFFLAFTCFLRHFGASEDVEPSLWPRRARGLCSLRMARFDCDGYGSAGRHLSQRGFSASMLNNLVIYSVLALRISHRFLEALRHITAVADPACPDGFTASVYSDVT